MKKLFMFLLAGAFAMTTSAQTAMPDGSFENAWIVNTCPNGDYNEYSSDLFTTLNFLYEMDDVGLLTAYKETSNPQDGSLCIKLVSKLSGVFLPGALGTIAPNFVQEYLDNNRLDVRRDYEFASQPQALTGYYKYTSVFGDSAAIEIGMYNNDELLAENKMIEYTNVGEWKSFRLPLVYGSEALPNKAKILFVASAGYDFANLENCQGEDGSTMWVDNIAFDYTDGLREPIPAVLKTSVFPVPATSGLTISWNENRNVEVVIYNVNGAMVAKQNVSGSQMQLNLSDLESGNYFYRLLDGKTILSSGKFVVTK